MPIFSRHEITAILEEYRELSSTNLKLVRSGGDALAERRVEQAINRPRSPMAASLCARDNRPVLQQNAIEQKHFVLQDALSPKAHIVAKIKQCRKTARHDG